jgi:L-alanine-DL-glutamate epimerase-like enolase superfamily enzyme
MPLLREPLDLETRYEFRISRGSAKVHHNTLVRLRTEGIEGLGEASPSHYYGENRATVEAALDAWAPHLGDDPLALDAIEARLDAVLTPNGAARAALDAALHDWIGKKLGLPVWRWLGLDAGRVPPSAVSLGLASAEEMERKLDEVRDFPIIKVKLGAPGDVENLERVRRNFAGRIYVDANGAWSARQAVEVLRRIEPLGITLVEQPVPRWDLDGLRWIRERIGIPLFADESVHTAHDVPGLAGRVDGINIKMMKCGGIREGLRMIHAARACGMAIMLGSMVESSLALSQAAQLAPLADHLDLDGHWLLARDPFDGAPRDRGLIVLGERPGLGVVPSSPGPA